MGCGHLPFVEWYAESIPSWVSGTFRKDSGFLVGFFAARGRGGLGHLAWASWSNKVALAFLLEAADWSSRYSRWK